MQSEPHTCIASSTFTVDSASEEEEGSDTSSENTTYHTTQSCGSQEEESTAQSRTGAWREREKEVVQTKQMKASAHLQRSSRVL